jgi:hypothetical protein
VASAGLQPAEEKLRDAFARFVGPESIELLAEDVRLEQAGRAVTTALR